MHCHAARRPGWHPVQAADQGAASRTRSRTTAVHSPALPARHHPWVMLARRTREKHNPFHPTIVMEEGDGVCGNPHDCCVWARLRLCLQASVASPGIPGARWECPEPRSKARDEQPTRIVGPRTPDHSCWYKRGQNESCRARPATFLGEPHGVRCRACGMGAIQNVPLASQGGDFASPSVTGLASIMQSSEARKRAGSGSCEVALPQQHATCTAASQRSPGTAVLLHGIWSVCGAGLVHGAT